MALQIVNPPRVAAAARTSLAPFLQDLGVLFQKELRALRETVAGPPKGLAVIITARNEERTIERCVLSLLGAAPVLGKPINILIALNASTDGTEARVQALAERENLPVVSA